MPFKDASQLIETVTELRESYQEAQRADADFQALGAAYFAGRQWLTPRNRFGVNQETRRLETDFSPESRKLRVVDNFTTMFTQMAEAATHPFALPLQIRPAFGDVSAPNRMLAEAWERVLEGDLRCIKALACTSYANLMAAVVGSNVIGIELHRRNVPGTVIDPDTGRPVMLGDWTLRWTNIASTQLILDPANTHPDLRDHDEVAVRQYYTVRRASELFGVRIDAEKARTLGELAQTEINASVASDGIVFGEYARMSRTKAVEVTMYFRKSSAFIDRFDEFYIVLDDPGTDRKQWVNEKEEGRNPFGGDGLPLGLMNYNPRPGKVTGQGATHQMMNAQDLANLHTTLYMRGLLYSSVPTWLIDSRSISQQKWAEIISNTVGGVIPYRGGDSTTQYNKPESILTAGPNPQHLDRIADMERKARDRVHRSSLHQGLAKSHVPDVTNERLLNESDRVPNIIVENYAKVLSDLLGVTLGTYRRAIDAGGITLLRRWAARGMTPEDLTILKRLDPDDIQLDIYIERDAIRPRSPFQRRNEVLQAAARDVGLISPVDARVALAADAEMPLTEYDHDLHQFAQDSLARILAGEEYAPVRLSEVSDHQFILKVFQQALLTANRTRDPSARARLESAIERQRNVMAELQRQTAAVEEGLQTPNPAVPGGVDLTALLGGTGPQAAEALTA